MRRNKTKNRLVTVLLILVLLISVGYATLTTNFTINGNATIKMQSLIVYFSNIQIKSGSITPDTEPTLSNNNTTITWEVSMNAPGQYYEFNVDIVNNGTMDAMVNTATNSIVSSTLTAEQQEYLDYTIKYVNGAEIEQYDKLEVGETKTITVKLLFKQDIDPEDLPQTAQSGISLSYETNYVLADGNAVTKKTRDYVIGDTVNYSTTLNGQTLDNWKVFYVDGDYTYIILSDYMPNAAISSTMITNYNLRTSGLYNVYSNNRTNLINAMSTKSNWDGLLTGTIDGHEVNETQTENVWAMGAPTIDLWANSWNAKYPSDTLYTRYVDTEDVDNSIFYATGYTIGDLPNPTSSVIDLSRRTGYNNTLYFPYQERNEDNDWTEGYWLASPAVSGPYRVYYVQYDGKVDNGSFDWTRAFRPVVCLPSSVVNQ